LLPAWAGVALLFLVPLLVIALYSLLTRGAYWGLGLPWTLENYARIFDPLYAVILLRSVMMAAAATALCLLLAFPAALFISRAGRRKNLYLHLVIIPFWTSFLVRAGPAPAAERLQLVELRGAGDHP
jgi:spermidine/putrescine transport system permease protein